MVVETIFIHWYGKFLLITGKGLVDRLPIITFVNSREHPQDISALNIKTGSIQANMIYQTLGDLCLTEST